MSFMRHLRRQRRRRPDPGRRRGWRRTYTVRQDELPWNKVRVYTVLSRDAPIGPEDERFWRWVVAGLLLIAATGIVLATVVG